MLNNESIKDQPIVEPPSKIKGQKKSGYDIFLGCVISSRLPFLETGARKSFGKLGIELHDVEGFSCCPDPTGVELVSHSAWLALGARNLTLSSAENGIVSFCSGCVETLKGVNHGMKERHAFKEANKFLAKVGKQYDGKTKVTHFAQILYEQLDNVKKNVTNPLKNFKVAVHYGCHYLRPSEIIQWDDPFKPVTVDAIVEALGAESIPYEFKMECCGNPTSKMDKDISLLIAKRKLDAIKKTDANCIVVVCPACYQQFDFNQKEINNTYGTDFNYPVFYLSEAVALSFGFTPDELGMKFHATRVKKFFEEINFDL
ncbi:MAG: CoB--CoM heterodisulfide reductase iron-sulfur subunit B family protein [Promethearchaeota archaeon]|nr:MAG: CoB--CoM heterodisulfide reductase iron-sulfur subunit B family protein [Candidatus Lokiarchaeota archaeon]